MLSESKKIISDAIDTEVAILMIESQGSNDSISETRAKVKKQAHSSAVEDYKRAKADLAHLEMSLSMAQDPVSKAQIMAAIDAKKAQILSLDAKRTETNNDQKQAIANAKNSIESWDASNLSLKDISRSILMESLNENQEGEAVNTAAKAVAATPEGESGDKPEAEEKKQSNPAIKNIENSIARVQQNITNTKVRANNQINQNQKTLAQLKDRKADIEASLQQSNESFDVDAFSASLDEELNGISAELDALSEGPISALRRHRIEGKLEKLAQLESEINVKLLDAESKKARKNTTEFDGFIEYYRNQLAEIAEKREALQSKEMSLKDSADPDLDFSDTAEIINEGLSFSRKRIELLKAALDSVQMRLDEYQSKYDGLGPGHIMQRYKLRKKIAEANDRIEFINSKLAKYDGSGSSTGMLVHEDYEFASDLTFKHRIEPSPIKLQHEKDIMPFDTKQREIAAKSIADDANTSEAFEGESGKVLNSLIIGGESDPETEEKAKKLMSDTTAASMVRSLKRMFRDPEADPKDINRLKMKIDMAYRKIVG
jgi:hypothetical protein